MQGIYSYETKTCTKWRVNKQVKDPVTDKPIKIQKKGFDSKKEAEGYLTDALLEIRKGKYVTNSKATVSELLDEWFERRVQGKLKPSTVEGYTTNVKHIKRYLGNVKLQKLRFEMVEDFYEELAKNGRMDGKGGLSGKSITYVHRVLSLALDYAVSKELIPRNVAQNTDRPEIEEYTPQILKKEEVHNFIRALKGSDIEVPAMLGLSLGLRRAEVCGLTWDQIDFENKILTVNKSLVRKKWGYGTPKTKKSNRKLPLPDFIVEMLRKHQLKQKTYMLRFGSDYDNNNAVYCKENGELRDPGGLSEDFKVFLEENCMKHIRFHDLRHTYASLGYESGVDLKEISELLGHSTIRITADIYTHISDEKKRESQKNIMNAIFDEKTVQELSRK